MKADLATDVNAAAAAEFDYLEIQVAKLREFLKTHSVKDLKTLFDEIKLKPLSDQSRVRRALLDRGRDWLSLCGDHSGQLSAGRLEQL